MMTADAILAYDESIAEMANIDARNDERQRRWHLHDYTRAGRCRYCSRCRYCGKILGARR